MPWLAKKTPLHCNINQKIANLIVVNISPLLLSDGKKVFSVKPLDGMDRFTRADLAG